MSNSPLYEELNKLIKEREGLEAQIKSICDSKQTRLSAIQVRKTSHDDLYHSLVMSLGSVTEKIKTVKRRVSQKDKAVRFSSTPPPSSSTPFLPLTIPQTVNTVSAPTISSTPPTYSTPPSETIPSETPLFSNENISTTPKVHSSRTFNQNSRQEQPIQSNATPQNTSHNNNMPNNTMPSNAMPGSATQNNPMPNYTSANYSMPNNNNAMPNNTMPSSTSSNNSIPNNNNAMPNNNALLKQICCFLFESLAICTFVHIVGNVFELFVTLRNFGKLQKYILMLNRITIYRVL